MEGVRYQRMMWGSGCHLSRLSMVQHLLESLVVLIMGVGAR